MKQLTKRIFPLFLSLILMLSAGMTALASGDGNLDGGGGGMGSGTATDVWHNQDGVRVTVVTEDGGIASTPFDLSNANVANNVLNFGKVCKLQYSSGSSLSPNGSYSYSKPGTALPPHEKNSPYWDHYCDQINELCNAAADLYNELDDVKNRLMFQMPAKKIAFCDEDDCSQTATAWFNTAAAMLSDTDMAELLEHENIYCADEWAEKQKRISALNRLTKQQQMLLYTEVTGFITRYLELSAAFETIEAVIAELDYHQSAMKGNGSVTLPQSAYV